MSLESGVFLVLYVSAVTAAWLVTYSVHSTVLIGAVWLLNCVARLARPMRELTWKLALMGSVVTATVALAAGVQPFLGRFETASVVEARIWGGTPVSLPRRGDMKRPTSRQIGLDGTGTTSPADARDVNRVNALETEQFAARIPKAATVLRYVPLALVLLWLIYAVAVLLRVVHVTARARRSLGVRVDVSGEAAEIFQAVAKSMGLHRPVRFTISEQLASPVALGRSEITMPRRILTELSVEDQRSVVAHEVAHLVRRDPWWLLAAATTESLFFFQPLNRMARMKWQEHAEYMCDELVVREQGSGLPLARALARVAEWLSTDTHLLAPALSEEPRTLLGRVKVLLQGGAPEPRPGRLARAALLVLPALVLCGSPALAPGSVRGWGTAAFHWAGVVPQGQSVEVQGVLGSIRAEPSPGDSVEVKATRHGRSTDPDVHFGVVRRLDGVTICAVYPTPDSVPPNVCTPGAAGQHNTRANDVEIEFLVHVPRGVNVVASSATGNITTGLLRGAVSAHSVSGDIDIATTEHASAETRSGNIRVSMGRTMWDGTVKLSTLAGNIWLALPAASSVDVAAETATGTIRSDFQLGQARPSWWSRLKPTGSLGSSAHGVIGKGGRQLELSTLAGNIVVKRR